MRADTRQSILVVDDNRDFTELVVLLFPEYTVRQAWCAGDALKIARTQPVHLYLLDHHLPGMTGLQMCRMIRTFDRNTPVMMFSAAPLDQRAVSDAGANEFVVKGADAALFVSRVRALMQKQSLRNETARMVEESAIADHIKDEAMERAAGDVALSRRLDVMRQQVADARKLVDELRKLRAESFSRYSAWGGARAGFVADWPEVARSIKSIRST